MYVRPGGDGEEAEGRCAPDLLTQVPPTPAEYDYVSGEYYYSVRVPAHTDDARRLAAIALIRATVPGTSTVEDAPLSMEWFTGKAEAHTLKKHLVDRDDFSCFCDDVGWWCEEGDSAPVAFWAWEKTAVDAFERRADAEEADRQAAESGCES